MAALAAQGVPCARAKRSATQLELTTLVNVGSHYV